MKSYKGLFDICISQENRTKAIKKALKSKRIRDICKRRKWDFNFLLEHSYWWIVNFKPYKHIPIIIYEGAKKKERKILIPTMQELIVQHCVVEAMLPLFTHSMYEHSYASIQNRGAHKAKKQIEKWIRNDDYNTRYILKLDIRHFFDSIPHDILLFKLSRKIHDDRFMDLLTKIINTTDSGLPLGFYTSQWLSNWYLEDLDHIIKEKLKVKYYVRYMDDMVLCGRNKKKLHIIRLCIQDYLKYDLGLQLKPNWQVFLFDWNCKGRDLDFMGFRFYRAKTTLRKSILKRSLSKANKISKKDKSTIYDARQMLSYKGYFDCTDTHNFKKKYIDNKINFNDLKQIVSSYDKNLAMKGKLLWN